MFSECTKDGIPNHLQQMKKPENYILPKSAAVAQGRFII